MGKSPLGDAWGTESGLPDNFTHLVAEAWFGPNEESERDPDKVYLNLRGPAYGEDGELIGDEDGYTLIRKVRALHSPAISSIPAAALTAFARNEDRMQALQAGFQLHLAKPVDVDLLITTVARPGASDEQRSSNRVTISTSRQHLRRAARRPAR